MKWVLVLSVCLAVAWASSPQPDDNTFRNRDYQDPYPSYDSPAQGHYYYYYPAEEMMMKMEKAKEDEEKDLCDAERLLPTVILVDIFLGIIAGVLVGLIPPLVFPNQWGAVVDQVFQPVVVGQVGGNGRANDEKPMELSALVHRALEKEECLPRAICESGKYAQDYGAFMGYLDMVVPSHFHKNMKIFQDSAMKKNSCRKFKCTYAEWMKL